LNLGVLTFPSPARAPGLRLPSSCVRRLARPQTLIQGLACGFQNEAAFPASIQVPLDLTFHARRELPFQIPANQMDGIPACHSCPTSSGPAWVGPFSSPQRAIRPAEKLFKLEHSGFAVLLLALSPHRRHFERSKPTFFLLGSLLRTGRPAKGDLCTIPRIWRDEISLLFLPSRHPDPVGASRHQRSQWPTGGTLRLWLPRRKPKRSTPRELRARR
jgi:hypothetical protein